MSVNTSFSPNASPHSPHISSSNSSSPPILNNCFKTKSGISIFTAFTAANILLLLPLCVYILSLGVRQWRKRFQGAASSHTEVFTYHMVVMELFSITGSILCCGGSYAHNATMMLVGCNVFAILSCVKMFFHILTCVDRYLAIVHPMTYLSMKKEGEILIRNLAIGFVWLLCCGLMAVRFLTLYNFNMIMFFCSVVFSLIVISVCSVSVLYALIRPGPGEAGDDGGDKTKQRAFITITAIMGVLLFRFGGNLVCHALTSTSLLSGDVKCAVQTAGILFCLPSGYVQPLLFLHGRKKLPCVK